MVAIALFGPLVAPHSPTEFVAAPNAGPSANALFGADALGRDVFSRWLYGGLTVLLDLGRGDHRRHRRRRPPSGSSRPTAATGSTTC